MCGHPPLKCGAIGYAPTHGLGIPARHQRAGKEGEKHMIVKNKKTGTKGHSDTFNVHALSEIIVTFPDNYSSEYIADYDVYLESRQAWYDMQDAFREKLIIPDNYNTRFREPVNAAEQEKGWY